LTRILVLSANSKVWESLFIIFGKSLTSQGPRTETCENPHLTVSHPEQ